jgi:hypothetical protein
LRNVPEGRYDRSLARSAWNRATGMRADSTVAHFDEKHLWDEAPDHTVPYGTALFGYDRTVPTGQFAIADGIRHRNSEREYLA